MALDGVIVQQDPFHYAYTDYSYNITHHAFEEEKSNPQNLHIYGSNRVWDSPASISSPGKRRRVKSTKNKEDMENQRMTHIVVERNRRKQMNDYLAILRSIMPPSYTQRGDQASIVGAAINFVKELEQLQQNLQANNPANQNLFSNFFTFPQYSTRPSAAVDAVAGIADIEVTMVDCHANIKVSTKRHPKQLLKLVSTFQSVGLTILHLNITTVDQTVLYSFSVKFKFRWRLNVSLLQ
ncbi:transcription factor bHLH96-like isoform X2 [Salvia splendens]|uniref:transcription factor bHLH96-like isoform X2 n=1 Tax=Salvia splendens TaxID=180675 RepID=UPI001C266291|nr:transcription factor bHLH96-like isoform X2 [Salvia splendens]